MDNTLLYLPKTAVKELGLEPNLEDKGDVKKELWYGRVWELRALIAEKYKRMLAGKRHEVLTSERKAQLDKACADPQTKKVLQRMHAMWRGAAFRTRCSLSCLEKLKSCTLRGTLLYCHGSGGNSWDNMRICRMIAKLGVLVIVPDDFAYPRDTAMGKLRHKDTLPLKKADDDTDYWEGDLIYSSKATGEYAYSTLAEGVLKEPHKFKELYERAYKLRASELHFIIERLPRFMKTEGIFMGGTSEGAMTIARFDDQRYGALILGRFINSFSIEYCYFTPTPESGKLGGQIEVPTLNIIGTKDEFFGPIDSVAKIVAADANTGYGAKNLSGNGYLTMVEQKVRFGLVCIFEEGMHAPCDTHDNFLRPLFDIFFRRPHDIWKLGDIWSHDQHLKDLCYSMESTITHESKVVKILCPKMKGPQSITGSGLGNMMKQPGFKEKLKSMQEQEDTRNAAKKLENAQMLEEFKKRTKTAGGGGF